MKPFWTNEKLHKLKILKYNCTNGELAEIFQTSKQHIRHSMEYFGIERTRDEVDKLLCGQNKKGSNNGNWKGGISKNNYRYKKLQVQRYPKRILAREKVTKAMKSGKLIRQNCKFCGTDQNIQAHILDYEKPLTSVIWACRPCNRREHRGGKY